MGPGPGLGRGRGMAGWALGWGEGGQDPQRSWGAAGTRMMIPPPPRQAPCQLPSIPVAGSWRVQVSSGPWTPTSPVWPSCPRGPVASLTRAGAADVGPGFRQQVQEDIAQEAPQGEAEQLLQAPSPSCKAETPVL